MCYKRDEKQQKDVLNVTKKDVLNVTKKMSLMLKKRHCTKKAQKRVSTEWAKLNCTTADEYDCRRVCILRSPACFITARHCFYGPSTVYR